MSTSKNNDLVISLMSILNKVRTDRLLGALILAIVFNYVPHKKNKITQIDETTMSKIMSKFETTKNTLDDYTLDCINDGTISIKRFRKTRNEERDNLANIVMSNIDKVDPDVAFRLSKLTRFEQTKASANLCKMNKPNLNVLHNKLNDMGIDLILKSKSKSQEGGAK